MARKDQKKSRKDQYRDILENAGIRFEDCTVLAFNFEREKGPEIFHLWLMLDKRRPKYYLFDCWERTAQVVIPKDESISDIVCDIATRADGVKVNPNLL